jgi:phenylacetate-CoA ligase
MTYALIANRYGWHGLSLNQKQARFYGIPLSGSSRLVEQTKDLIANRVRFPVFDLSDEKLKKFSLSFASQKFNYLYGYTSALILFAQYLVTENRVLKQICPSLSACIVTSEVCTSENKNLLELAFGIPVLNEYGASELDVIAFTDKSGDWILSEENLFVEILDENNQPAPYGQEGKIVITSLHNRAFPMVRYEIGDIGSIERAIKCRLLHLSGRTNDVIKLPSGKKAAGLTFYYVSRSILESGGALKEFVIKQTSLDTFVFEVVADSPIPPDSEMKIRSAMKLYLEDGLNLKINRVAKIDRPIAGKIKHFYSLIQ